MSLPRLDSGKLFPTVVAMFFISLLFSSRDANANCAFFSCMKSITIDAPLYQILWLIAVFCMIWVTNFILVKLLKIGHK